ncbi:MULTISPECIES: DoxX family membrane protein [unclassified Pseudonocardia]|jgi:thiosulfate dehydrogenase [quinone] large subunit|uniref:DoxX family membrane protein n=1 Tax=unclassified Pseudonocardia TaxID=2619320 RepID=UPI0009620380|nr:MULTISPECIES: DoxX family membrane protein [unclassified Pseudonocardia]MBN9096761.1 DoxX family membrane protein [Pseudonocardia sp.]OJY51783.1 MAG: hypothetical protein BGP03_03675 [Pseudonocardia sp. 73-21]
MSVDQTTSQTTARSTPLSTAAAMRSLATLRIATGFVFLWAFLDKTFGFGFATPAPRAWINGGSPTKGFLSSVDVGPLQGFFHSIAGAAWADWLFMVGLLGVGLAVLAGVALRVSAVAGVAMMAMMWLAEFPPATLTATGAASGSSNPFLDYHVMYAIALVVIAATFAGTTWGLGRAWAHIPFVNRHRWML